MKIGNSFEYLKKYVFLMIYGENTTSKQKHLYPTTANKSAYISQKTKYRSSLFEAPMTLYSFIMFGWLNFCALSIDIVTESTKNFFESDQLLTSFILSLPNMSISSTAYKISYLVHFKDMMIYFFRHLNYKQTFRLIIVAIPKLHKKVSIYFDLQTSYFINLIIVQMYSLLFGDQSIFITKAQNKKRALQISYHNHSIQEIELTIKDKKILSFDCFMGMKYIKKIPVLLLVSETKEITVFGSSKVWQIKKIKFVPVVNQNQQQTFLNQNQQQLAEIQSIFDMGFHYFSQEYDLSLPYLSNKVKHVQRNERFYYNQFIWNLALTKIETNTSQTELLQKWCSKIIQGYIQQFKCDLPHQKARYIIISRRSFKKTGTRFYSRGIDDLGNVANYVQTEQIMYLGNYIFTHLQIRGSVPAFFAQIGVNGIACDMVIERTIPLTRNAFHLHFSKVKQIYSRVLAVNLLSEKKSEQLSLSNFYQAIVSSEASTMPFMRYQFYDFHQQCKNNKFQNSEVLIQKLDGVVDAFGYNCFDISATKLIKEQKGVFRTNCLDCLDRTNYIQSRLALRSLKHFILRFSNQEIHTLCKQKKLLDFPVNEQFPLLRGFNALWAQNGDGISTLYTGIGSTHTDITRTGQRTLFGAFNHKFRSLMRFYIQFNDHLKHEAMNKLVAPTLKQKKNYHKNDYHTTLLFSIDNELPVDQAIQNFKKYLYKKRPTIIVYFVFQKRKLNIFQKMKCIASNQTTDFKDWQKTVTQQIQKQNYHRLGNLRTQMGWMGVFCSEQVVSQVGEVRQQNLTTQLNINGEVFVLKMKLFGSTFVFACVNIPNFQQFVSVFDEIHEKAFQVNKLGIFKSSSFISLDYKVVIGNTGAKISLIEKELMQLEDKLQQSKMNKNQRQANKILGKILDYDQMNDQRLKYKNKYLRQYNEGPLNFVPSYNRMVFWNEQNVVLRVRDYQQVQRRGNIVSVLEYEVGKSLRESQAG